MALDIASLRNISSPIIEEAVRNSNLQRAEETGTDSFSNLFNAAVNNIYETNSYLSEAENEELKFSMGLTDNTHDLTIALQKASTALQYTVAVRDKLLEAYKEIMNINL